MPPALCYTYLPISNLVFQLELIGNMTIIFFSLAVILVSPSGTYGFVNNQKSDKHVLFKNR